VLSGLVVASLDEDVPPHAASESRLTSAINEECGRVNIYTY